jgi:Protein of unknown function (DUF3606)
MKKAASPGSGIHSDRIDISTPRELDKWSRKLDVTHDRLREAVRAVGSRASDIEWHLRGSRHAGAGGRSAASH